MKHDETTLEARISLARGNCRTAYYAACSLRTFAQMPYATLFQHHRGIAAECRGICETGVFASLIGEDTGFSARQRRSVGYLAFFSTALVVEAEHVRDPSLKTRATEASDFLVNAFGSALEDMTTGLRIWENEMAAWKRSLGSTGTRQATIVNYARLNQLTLKLDTDMRTIRAALDVAGLLSVGDIAAGFELLAACHPVCMKAIGTHNATLHAGWFEGQTGDHDLQEIGLSLSDLHQENIAANRGHPDWLAEGLRPEFINPLALLFYHGAFDPVDRQPARKTVLERKIAQLSR